MPLTERQRRAVAELVCAREERQGYPSPDEAVERAVIEAGGDFMHRVRARAQKLPTADADARAWSRLWGQIRLLALVLVVLMAVSGALAASAALSASRPASLPLLLFALVGINLLMLLLWLLTLVLPLPRIVAPLAERLLRRFTRPARADERTEAASDTDLLRLIFAGPSGRWLIGAASHLAWGAFTTGAWAALVVLLSLKAYPLSWETTLLSADALARWAQWLSFGPALLGVVPAGGIVAGAPVDGVAWSQWLLAAVLVYGLAPRMLGLLLSLIALRLAMGRWARDAARPGYARLRSRLMPDHLPLGVRDAAPTPVSADLAIAPAVDAITPLSAGLLAYESGLTAAPATAGSPATWLGDVDDRASRQRALDAVRAAAPIALTVLVRGRATPDRGAERFLVELAAAAGAAPVLRLIGLDTADAEPVPDRWRTLAQAAGIADVARWTGQG